MPAKLELIVDVDVRLIPGTPGTSSHDLEVFRQTLKNERNRSRRKVIFLKAWTKIYSFLSELCVDACPSLYEELYNMCRMDLRGIPGGVFDGPLAYRMYMASLKPAERTKEDRERRPRVHENQPPAGE